MAYARVRCAGHDTQLMWATARSNGYTYALCATGDIACTSALGERLSGQLLREVVPHISIVALQSVVAVNLAAPVFITIVVLTQPGIPSHNSG